MVQENYPTFPETGLRFLRSLKRNNNREWFQEHRDAYEESVRAPLQNFVEAMAEEFDKFAPDIAASAKVSMFRIYRDTRFSRNKLPYKTHAALVFPHKLLDKHAGAGFYVHIDPKQVYAGGGLYMPASEDLRAVREEIARHHERFEHIVTARPFQKMFNELSGEQLIRVPRGFPQDHPAADYLRFKQYLASRQLPPAILATRKFQSSVVETFRTLYPLIQFLNAPILSNLNAKQRQDSFLKHH